MFQKIIFFVLLNQFEFIFQQKIKFKLIHCAGIVHSAEKVVFLAMLFVE